MAFQLNGKPINIDKPYTTAEGVKYANLRNPAIREQLGVVEVPDAPYYDQRFYWGVDNPKLLDDREESDEEGNPLYVKVLGTDENGDPVMVDSDVRLVTKGLKSQWIAQVKHTAGSLLSQTDWYIIRSSERQVAVPANVVASISRSLIGGAATLQFVSPATPDVLPVATLPTDGSATVNGEHLELLDQLAATMDERIKPLSRSLEGFDELARGLATFIDGDLLFLHARGYIQMPLLLSKRMRTHRHHQNHQVH